MISNEKEDKKRQQEQAVVSWMIGLYCKKHHPPQKSKLCPDCQKLLVYADERIRKCPFMESKSFCSNCRVHCYSPAMREQIRGVMRYSGPRMLLFHPIMAIHHILCTILEKTKKKEKKRHD